MKNIAVNASTTYQVLIGRGLLEHIGTLARQTAGAAEKIALITDSNVEKRYAGKVVQALTAAGFSVIQFVLAAGEASKNGENFIRILNFLAAGQLTRSDLILALGGGMTGDIAGFAAASYLRGIAYVQAPTTLLAAVDSSVGGKTAIDLEAGKNLAGAFYQPGLVVCDYDTLGTLTPAVFTDGCAEVIKYGVLGGGELFQHLEERGTNFDTEYVIGRCVEMKRDYVCADEFDNGLRRRLNLGHTLAHAVEAQSNFAVSHGSAVAIGMATVSRAAAAKGLCAPETAERIVKLLEVFGLPVKTDYGMDVLFGHMLSDKKRRGELVHLIVPRDIGRCETIAMGLEEMKEFMKAGI